MRFTAADIAQSTQGTLFAPEFAACVATGIAWDSRQVAPGDAFIALCGAKVDGHDFCEQALQSGATVLIVSRRPDDALIACAAETGAAIVRVGDALDALGMLAATWRQKLSGTVVALTGSSGKTTTKNFLRDVLRARGTVWATESNQNNELGVPATLLGAPESAVSVVVEMGMRGLGQIRQLCDIAQPTMGLVTNVGHSHIELLGSRDNIARAKAEIYEQLPKDGGVAFVDASSPLHDKLVEYGQLDVRGVEAVHFDGSGASYAPGLGPKAQVYATNVALDASGMPSFTLVTPDGSAPCTLQLMGQHNVANACAAAAVGWRAGLDVQTIAQALESTEPVAGRARVVRAANGATVVDDCYNANPDSMRASLVAFAAMDAPGRRIAVLGDMGELGDFAEQCHRDIGLLVASLDIDKLVCVGDLAQGIGQAACEAGFNSAALTCVPAASDALAAAEAVLEPNDTVLVKASHAVGLDQVVEGLVG